MERRRAVTANSAVAKLSTRFPMREAETTSVISDTWVRGASGSRSLTFRRMAGIRLAISL